MSRKTPRAKLELGKFEDWKHKFFVRVKAGNVCNEKKAVIEDLFGTVKYVSVDSAADEVAFVTEEIAEGRFKELSAKLQDIISVIRVSF